MYVTSLGRRKIDVRNVFRRWPDSISISIYCFMALLLYCLVKWALYVVALYDRYNNRCTLRIWSLIRCQGSSLVTANSGSSPQLPNLTDLTAEGWVRDLLDCQHYLHSLFQPSQEKVEYRVTKNSCPWCEKRWREKRRWRNSCPWCERKWCENEDDSNKMWCDKWGMKAIWRYVKSDEKMSQAKWMDVKMSEMIWGIWKWVKWMKWAGLKLSKTMIYDLV